MSNTQASEVYDSFESTFTDKKVIPASLELVWLKKAIGIYGLAIEELSFDDDLLTFSDELDRHVIDTLGMYMKKFYQEREVSRMDKYPSIVMDDISIDGNNGGKTAAREELKYASDEVDNLIEQQKPASFV